jgi:hypothetical protein
LWLNVVDGRSERGYAPTVAQAASRMQVKFRGFGMAAGQSECGEKPNMTLFHVKQNVVFVAEPKPGGKKNL